MPTATWKFVDQPVANPTVLFDMNRPNGSVLLNFGRKFDISPPQRKRSFNTNSMTDGGVLTASAFENRTLEFSVSLQGTDAQKMAALAAFTRELAKDNNLIMYTPKAGSINPVFFRTMRSDDFVSPPYRGGDKGAWHIDCKVLAEPYAIGTRIDHTTGAVITNDPASGTNPARIDFTGIIGDGVTPPIVRIAPGAAGGLKNNPFYLSQRTGLNFTNYVQAELASLQTDTAAAAGDANASGSGNKLATTTFATNTTMSGRMLVSWSATTFGAENIRGRYRVLVRVGTNTTGSTFKMRWALPQGNNFIRGRAVQVTLDSTKRQIVDLGMIAHPTFEAPKQIGYSGLSAGIETLYVYLDAQRISGANLEWDYVLLLPADERTCIFGNQTSDGGNGVNYIVLDGPNDATYGMDSGTSLFGATANDRLLEAGYGMVPRLGGLPLLVPGVTNRWYILQESSAITVTNTLDMSYWPKWLEVATV